MVVALDVVHLGACDVENGHASAVHAPDLDLAQFAAAHEPEGAQEEVLGLKHRRLLRLHACLWIDGGEFG